MTTLKDVLNIQKTLSVLASPAIKPVLDTGLNSTSTAPGSTLSIDLQNQTQSSSVYAYPARSQQNLEVDCAISLGALGTTTTITIPYLAGGRIWFSQDSRLTFFLNPGPALVEPSVLNTFDPNRNIHWDFVNSHSIALSCSPAFPLWTLSAS
ncbi:hypothetical protein M432DRAFT_127320 [Thermoascus aurantiacus ATCC 26904]